VLWVVECVIEYGIDCGGEVLVDEDGDVGGLEV